MMGYTWGVIGLRRAHSHCKNEQLKSSIPVALYLCGDVGIILITKSKAYYLSLLFKFI